MTTEQTAQQLKLAAQILRTGHPFEVCHDASDRWHASLGVNPAQAVLQNWCLRPVLATPPDNRPLHNPDNLTAEAVGVGYRLTVEGELVPGVGAEWWCRSSSAWLTSTGAYLPQRNTVRVPLKRPWPPASIDPYAELKAAHAAGKVIQILNHQNRYVDADPTWTSPVEYYRIKPEPEAPPTQLSDQAQLPPPPPGMQWHRTDGWKAEDLPQGHRPLTMLEIIQEGDEFKACFSVWKKAKTRIIYDIGRAVDAGSVPFRTTRPLTFEHAGKTWTWHRPGDPCPCDPMAKICIWTGNAMVNNGNVSRLAGSWNWMTTTTGSAIIGWRYAEPQTKTVPLGPEDVPPCSVFRLHDDDIGYEAPSEVAKEGVTFADDTGNFTKTWGELTHWQINRPRHRDADGNPTKWEPCSKTIPA